jgi:hypothetical protein
VINAINAAIPQDENIPKAPNEMSKKGRAIFSTLNIRPFFTNMKLAARFDIKTPSKTMERVQIRLKNKNDKKKRGVARIKVILGAHTLRPNMNTNPIIREKTPLIVKQEFIISMDSFSLVFGKNLISPILNPKLESKPIRNIEDIIADASPTFSELKSLATINQKIKPRPDTKTVFIIR